MAKKIISIMILAFIVFQAGAFTKKSYSNYNRDAVTNFLYGLFSEQIMNTDGVKRFYERAYEETGAEYIKFNLAIAYILSDRPEDGYRILNELYDKGFKLGRSGIYLYLDELKKDKKTRSDDILDKIIAELYENNEIATASMVISQKVSDRLYSFASNEEFEKFFSEIYKKEFNMIYKIYFSTVAIQFYSKTSQDTLKIRDIIDKLESEYSELPYIFYRYVFDEYIYLKDFEKAEDILKIMSKYTLGEAKYYSDAADLYEAKNDYAKARNTLILGMKEFPESSLNLQLAKLYLSQKDLSKAEIVYDEVLNRFPDSSYLYEMVANEYTSYGELEKTIRSYEKALEKFPEDAELLNNYAYVLAQNSMDLDKALIYIEKALKTRPSAITFLDTQAWVLFKLGKFQEAEVIMDKLFSDEESFYYSNSEELFDHYKEIKIALNKQDEIKNISINRTTVLLSEIFAKSNYILQLGF